jgi:hypothetical protein
MVQLRKTVKITPPHFEAAPVDHGINLKMGTNHRYIFQKFRTTKGLGSTNLEKEGKSGRTKTTSGSDERVSRQWHSVAA